MAVSRCYIGLGANLGDPVGALRAALAALAALPGTRLAAVSSLYRSAPIDAAGPDFFNAVAALDTSLVPLQLLAALHSIEAVHGRQRPYRNAPRTLDLDLLLYDDMVQHAPGLTLPHPRMHQRAFVLQPLLEIAPALASPTVGPLAAHLAATGVQAIERLPTRLEAPAFNPFNRFRHIAVEGTIGVGKSSLTRKLATRFGARPFLEQPEENPYLEHYYAAGTEDLSANPYALQTQLFFLFQRLEQMRELAQGGMFDGGLVSDFVFAKDALFARLTLGDEDHELYTQIYRRYAPRVPKPDLVIWLQASTPTLQARIARRGLAMEQGIADDYLRRIDAAYARHFESGEQRPWLAIDTEAFNPVEREADFERLLGWLQGFRGPHEYADPAADPAPLLVSGATLRSVKN